MNDTKRTSDKAATDIMEALYQLTHLFGRHQMTPAVLELASPEDGERFKYMITTQVLSMTPFVDDYDKVWNQVELMGIIVRWPAKAYAMPRGGFDFR